MTRGARVGFDERRELRLLGWAVAVVFVAGLLAFLAKGADNPPDPYLKAGAGGGLTPAAAAAPAPSAAVTVPLVRTPVPGFSDVAIRVASGPQLCALLAQTEAQRNRGLMAPTDLAGRVGMVFVFPGPTTESFYMRNTPMPLSIAWFDGSGRFVSAADMVPCADVPNCPLYSAARAYRYALEVPRGGLGGLGAGPGSQLTVGGAC